MSIRGLEYSITLDNQISKPLKAIKGDIDRIGEAGKGAMLKIGAGVAGIVAAGMALHSALGPALEMDRSLGDLNSLNVSADGIENVKDKALELSSAIGASAIDIAKNAYDVKKAIRGIADEDLGSANNAINLFGIVTKGNAQSATAYVGVMHGIFEREAKAIGQNRWVENLVSKTEKATTMFNASAQDYQAGFSAISNSAQMHGHSIEEQIAVMGQLINVTGSGGAAGGKYKKVLKSVEKAQKTLGLSFYDSKGKMNDMLTILTKIKGKYGNAIPKSTLLKAFGNDAGATIYHLINNLDEIKGQITDLQKTDGVNGLRQKAINATDGFLQLSSALAQIKMAIGSEILKVLYPVVAKIAEMTKAIGDWLTENKNTARLIGVIFTGFFVLTALIPIVLLLTGLFKMWRLAIAVMNFPLRSLGTSSKLVFPSIIGYLRKLATMGSPITLIFKGLKRVLLGLVSPFTGFIKYLRKLDAIGSPTRLLLKDLKDKLLRLLSPFIRLWEISKKTFSFLKSGIIGIISKLRIFLVCLSTNPLLALKAAGSSLWSSFLTGIKLVLSPFSLWIALFVGLGLFIYHFQAEIKAFFGGVLTGFMAWGVSFEPIKIGFAKVWEAILRIINVFRGLFTTTKASEQNLVTWASVGEVVGAGLAWLFQNLLDAIGLVADLIAEVANIFADVAQIIIDCWQDVLNAWGNNDIWGVFSAIGNGIANIFTRVLKGVKNMFFTFFNWLIDKINGLGEYIGIKLPKFQIEEAVQVIPQQTIATAGVANMALKMAGSVSQQQFTPKADGNGQIYSLGSAQPPKLNRSQNVSRQISTTQQVDKSTRISTVNVYANNPQEFERKLEEQAQLRS